MWRRSRAQRFLGRDEPASKEDERGAILTLVKLVILLAQLCQVLITCYGRICGDK